MPYFLSAPRLWYASSRICLLRAFPRAVFGFRRRRYSQYAIKKIKNAASKIAIIQYRMLPEDFFAQRKGFAAWQ